MHIRTLTLLVCASLVHNVMSTLLKKIQIQSLNTKSKWKRVKIRYNYNVIIKETFFSTLASSFLELGNISKYEIL